MKRFFAWCRPRDWWRFLKWAPGALFGDFNKAHYQCFEGRTTDYEEDSLEVPAILQRIFMGKPLTAQQEEVITNFSAQSPEHQELVEEYRDPERILKRLYKEGKW